VSSNSNDDPQDLPVTERVCQARRQALEERIEGLKNAIYMSSAAITTVLSIVYILIQLFLK